MERRHAASGSPFEASIGFSRAVRVGTHGRGERHRAGLAGRLTSTRTRRCRPGGASRSPWRRWPSSAAVRRTSSGPGSTSCRADDADAVGAVHGEVFGDIRPASTMVVVAALLDPRWKYEVELDARR